MWAPNRLLLIYDLKRDSYRVPCLANILRTSIVVWESPFLMLARKILRESQRRAGGVDIIREEGEGGLIAACKAPTKLSASLLRSEADPLFWGEGGGKLRIGPRGRIKGFLARSFVIMGRILFRAPVSLQKSDFAFFCQLCRSLVLR